VSAWERVDEEVSVDCLWAGVVSIVAIMRDVSAVAERILDKNWYAKGIASRTSCCYGFLESLGTRRPYRPLLRK
jgi:hypothetical protein